MLLRSLQPQICFAPDDGGAMPADTSPVGAPSDVSAPADTATSSGAETPPEPAPPPSLDEQLDNIWNDANRPRGEDGKFKSYKNPPVEGEETPPEDTPSGDGDEPPAGDEPDHPGDQTQDGAQAPTDDLPKSWSKDKAEVWKSLTPDAKDYIRQRETDMTQALSRAGRAVSIVRQEQPFMEALAPFKQYLGQVSQHIGRHPAELVHDVLRFEHTLRTAPSNDVKLQVLGQIAGEYGIDLSPLLGGDVAGALQRIQTASDPRVDQLARQIEGLTRQQQQARQAEIEASNAELATAVDAVAKDTQNFPHFALVKHQMGAILERMSPEEEAGKSISDLMHYAYEQACWTNPKIRSRMIAEQTQREQAKAERERQEKANRAKSAASVNVKSAAPSPSKRTVDADLAAIAAKHYR